MSPLAKRMAQLFGVLRCKTKVCRHLNQDKIRINFRRLPPPVGRGYFALQHSDLPQLAGLDVSNRPLTERKALLKPLVADKPGLQSNGHDTGDGDPILKLGFEAWFQRRSTRPMRRETAACGAKSKRLIDKNSSSSAGPEG